MDSKYISNPKPTKVSKKPTWYLWVDRRDGALHMNYINNQTKHFKKLYSKWPVITYDHMCNECYMDLNQFLVEVPLMDMLNDLIGEENG